MRMQYREVSNPSDISKPGSGTTIAASDAMAQLSLFMEKTIKAMEVSFDHFTLEFENGNQIAFISNPAPARVVFYYRLRGGAGPDDRG